MALHDPKEVVCRQSYLVGTGPFDDDPKLWTLFERKLVVDEWDDFLVNGVLTKAVLQLQDESPLQGLYQIVVDGGLP